MLKAAAAIFTFILGIAAHNAFAQSAAGLGLAPSADKIRPVLLGSKSPDAALKTLDGTSTTFKDRLGGKPAVVVFYRGGWCPYCTTRLRDSRVILKELGNLGCRVIAVSPDGVEALTAFMDKENSKTRCFLMAKPI
jgi:alkyl hydroperoxide reductase subunit AhpC